MNRMHRADGHTDGSVGPIGYEVYDHASRVRPRKRARRIAYGFLALGALTLRAASALGAEQDPNTTPPPPPAAPVISDVPSPSETARTPEQAEPAPAKASEEPSSLEITATGGGTLVAGEPANPEYSPSFRRVGAFGELAVAYRSSYFVDPFLSVMYGTLASGEAILPNGPWGAGGTVEQHLGTWVISPGITSDIWRFRLRFGLGVAVVAQSYQFLGQTHSTTQIPVANQLGLGFNFFASDRFRIDAETRIVLAPGADITFGTLGVVLRGDIVQFGRRQEVARR